MHLQGFMEDLNMKWDLLFIMSSSPDGLEQCIFRLRLSTLSRLSCQEQWGAFRLPAEGCHGTAFS